MYRQLLMLLAEKGITLWSLRVGYTTNHLIYQKHILSDKDAGELKKEIKDIKTPLVRRFNSVSLYNPDGPKFCDYQKEAFDISLDGADLLTR